MLHTCFEGILDLIMRCCSSCSPASVPELLHGSYVERLSCVINLRLLNLQIFGQQPGLAATLTQLQMARLSKITDEGLTSLSSLSELRSLSLAHTAELTRKGLAPLRSLSQLTALKCARQGQIVLVQAGKSALLLV